MKMIINHQIVIADMLEEAGDMEISEQLQVFLHIGRVTLMRTASVLQLGEI